MGNRIVEFLKAPGPSTSLQEILYGFIMALIFVYATRFGLLTYDDPINFVGVVIGMNATWGVIDGIIFYYLGVCNQHRYAKLVTDGSIEREERIGCLMDEFASTPLDVLTDEDKRKVCETMLDRELQSREDFRRDRVEMFKSSVGCVIWTLLTLIPVILPVLLIEDFDAALETASVLSSVILFFVGYYMGPYLGINRWVTGFVMIAISLGISIIATFTGG